MWIEKKSFSCIRNTINVLQFLKINPAKFHLTFCLFYNNPIKLVAFKKNYILCQQKKEFSSENCYLTIFH